eukprot:CAMPEP_0169134336 /NCGR_PEP_ID=MMETSP1015-20121227/39817_1 /TAXON_ID=342587 /ORGANISM="Karlodinium micrum, Strain CCMP2283" /LENGTH=56 /DNA_ID=CAMNT_0009198839 /DNA_START=106 /DNA_END=276 /DNA_ORIENTATION=-
MNGILLPRPPNSKNGNPSKPPAAIMPCKNAPSMTAVREPAAKRDPAPKIKPNGASH